MGKEGKERLSGLVVLLDKTTYEDPYNHKPVQCVVMVTEHETGDEQWRLPRIPLTERIVQAGPQTMSEYVRGELSSKIGLTIPEPLAFTEKLTESKRSFFIFVGDVKFYAATSSAYSSVKAQNFAQMQFFRDTVSNFHYEVAKRFLVASP